MEPAQTRNVISQLRRGTVEYCVLALLRDGERYGFELVRELSAVDGLVTSEGTIYPLLTRLRKDELVTTFWQESESGPPRRYYRLTDAGHTALADFTHEWVRFRDSVDAILKGRKGDDHNGD
jgi:PadR family transcriptional regulator PadR